MEHPEKRMRNPLKSRSVFFTISGSIALLCIVLCTLFSMLYTNRLIETASEKHLSSSQAQLNMMFSSTYYMISNLQQSLTQLSHTHNAISPSFRQTPDSNTINLAKNDIALANANNTLIESAFLYFPVHDLVITSAYNVYTLESFPNSYFILAHENGTPASVLIDNSGTTTSLYQYGDRLILTRDYPLNNEHKLATLNYVINTNEMYRLLTRDLAEDTQLWVYDAENVPVFYKNAAYPESITPERLDDFALSGQDFFELDGENLIFSTSPATGWRFVYVIGGAQTVGVRHILPSLLPVILLALVASVGITMFISSTLYRPLKRLLAAIKSDSFSGESGEKPQKNEIEYLNHAFSLLAGRQAELGHMLQHVSGDVINRFFLDLFAGVQFNHTTAREVLGSISSPFKVNAAYVGCAILVADGPALTEEQRGEFLRQAGHRLESFDSRNHSYSCLLPVDNRTFAIVLSFPEEAPILQIRQSLGGLETDVDAISRRLGMSATFSAGNIYHSVLDVGFSYNEAHKRLLPQSRPEAATEAPADAAEPADSTASTDAAGSGATDDFSVRAGQVLTLVGRGQQDDALLLVERVLLEILDDTTGYQEQETQVKLFANAFVDQIARHREYTNRHTLSNELLTADGISPANPDSALLTANAKSFFDDLIAELTKQQKKQKNHFIIDARNYIHDHYTDCDLSLAVVSEAVGTSQSYLSRLFNTILGLRFTDYLNKYRVDASLRLLESDLSVKEIAAACGFSSTQNYNRVFKKYMDMAPGQYREDIKA